MSFRAVVAMLLAFLVPGAGHLYLGRRGRALGFFCIIVFLFVLGLSIDGALYSLAERTGGLLNLFASIGSMGSGVLYFLGRATGPHGNITSITFEYGRMFTLSAGLMNLVLMIDCFDIAIGRKP